MDLVGHTLSPHLVDARLGAGARGVVYRARDLPLCRDVGARCPPAAGVPADPRAVDSGEVARCSIEKMAVSGLQGMRPEAEEGRIGPVVADGLTADLSRATGTPE